MFAWSKIAQFLHHDAKGMIGIDMMREIAKRWPDVTREELKRASAIAVEVIEAEAAEHEAEADALRAELARRDGGAA